MDANMIKLIAIMAMTIDHVTWMMFPGYPREFVPVLLHMYLHLWILWIGSRLFLAIMEAC